MEKFFIQRDMLSDQIALVIRSFRKGKLIYCFSTIVLHWDQGKRHCI